MTRTTMKSMLLASVAVAMFAGSAEAVHFHGWYVGLEGGINRIDDLDQVTAFSTIGGGTSRRDSESQFNDGWAVLATAGYAFDNNWRLEAEGGYRSNDLDIAIASTHLVTHSGDMNEYSLMANLLYDLQITHSASVSLGFGLGGDNAHYKLDGAADDSTWAFAYQAIAGLNVNIAPQWDLFANFRYMRVVGPSFGGGLPPALSVDVDGDIQKETLTVGLRYDLERDPEPVAPPPAPAPMAPPPPVKHFIVFFGFNKCNITAEADSVLSEAAAAAKANGSASVTIVGHTDTSGSTAYNQKLSECRANAAKSNLVGKGVPEGAISASGKGETELMVQTGDGVKEPQNRRATIDLN
jgi:outer membrane protein OmpA-like peptidoglycan-associated protein